MLIPNSTINPKSEFLVLILIFEFQISADKLRWVTLVELWGIDFTLNPTSELYI